jgi:hypothetical protein
VTEIDRVRWNNLLVELKEGLCSTPANVEAAKRWKTIKPGENDYDTCFREWWLTDVVQLQDGMHFFTVAGDRSATEAGIKKYLARLAKLVRKYFELEASRAVSFEVRRAEAAPTAEKTNNGQSANEGQSKSNGESHGANGETLVGMLLGEARDPWNLVKRELEDQLSRLGKRNVGDKLDWFHQAIEPAQLESVEMVDGKPLWKLKSPAPKKTRAVMSLLASHLNQAVNAVAGGGVRIEVLNSEGILAA